MSELRKKLAELLSESPFLDVLGGWSFWEEAADHLIANGVTLRDHIPGKVETNIFDKEEIFPDCTVQVLTNTATGETSVGWWKNGN